jgi:hypothetical protein
MKNFFLKLKSIKRSTIIKNSFLIPILSVVAMSISHVISWYDIGNPFAWAVYLSIAVEIFALASVSAASIKIKKGSIWLLFALVTLIQIIGNVFFTYQDIHITSYAYTSWIELVQPWFEGWTPTDHRRLLALVQGGTLPFMSLIALHFYIKFNDNLSKEEDDRGDSPDTPITPEPLYLDVKESEEEESVIEEQIFDNLEDSTNIEVEEEKKDDNEEIHISENLDAENRRRLHPSRY